jgi:hypothetical protein
MVTHVVFFKFSSPEEAQEARRLLLAMQGRIPGLVGVEAGLDFTRSERSFDLALITRHEDRQSLDVYRDHPVHQEVVQFIRPRATASAAVDFESSDDPSRGSPRSQQ